MDEIDQKVDHVIDSDDQSVESYIFSMIWMQWWVQIEEIPMSNADSVQIS